MRSNAPSAQTVDLDRVEKLIEEVIELSQHPDIGLKEREEILNTIVEMQQMLERIHFFIDNYENLDSLTQTTPLEKKPQKDQGSSKNMLNVLLSPTLAQKKAAQAEIHMIKSISATGDVITEMAMLTGVEELIRVEEAQEENVQRRPGRP